MTIQNVPSKGRISIIKFQNFTIQKRKPVIRVVYGTLLVCIGIIMTAIDPLEIITNWQMDIRNDSFVFHMLEKPSYQLFSEVWVFNYTNVPEFLDGTAKKLQLQEVGPFKFQETRTNENVTVNKERGVLSMVPKITLKFLPEESIAHSKDVNVFVPNIALIAISTVAADRLPYLANAGLYYSITALGSKLFRNMTAYELFWGFDDPIVTAAHNMMPGWIDFDTIGIMDRFYSEKPAVVELELKDRSKRFSINSWGGSPGIVEQGFNDLNTSTTCNRIKGSYEGMIISPNMGKDHVIPLYRRQACRIFPLHFSAEIKAEQGFDYYRYIVAKDAFNRNSTYACKCTSNCLPDGFVDISGCFYGFPIALSKPHFMDVDPVQASYYEGMNPDPEKHNTQIDVEPTLGVPLALSSKMQVNVAVRMSPGNPVTRPLKDKVLPIVWLQLYCKEAPEEVLYLLRLRIVVAPPLIVTVEVLLFVVGFILGAQGTFRIIKPKYKLKEIKTDAINAIRRSSLIVNISENLCYREEDEEEIDSLLGAKELESIKTSNT